MVNGHLPLLFSSSFQPPSFSYPWSLVNGHLPLLLSPPFFLISLVLGQWSPSPSLLLFSPPLFLIFLVLGPWSTPPLLFSSSFTTPPLPFPLILLPLYTFSTPSFSQSSTFYSPSPLIRFPSFLLFYPSKYFLFIILTLPSISFSYRSPICFPSTSPSPIPLIFEYSLFYPLTQQFSPPPLFYQDPPSSPTFFYKISLFLLNSPLYLNPPSRFFILSFFIQILIFLSPNIQYTIHTYLSSQKSSNKYISPPHLKYDIISLYYHNFIYVR